MDQSAESTPQPTRSASEIERIRELVVGPQMRQNEQKIGTLQKDLERLQREIQQLSGQLNEQSAGASEKMQLLRQDFQESVDEVRSEVRQVAEVMGHNKVDRQTLGELFVEMGNHLKDGGSLSELFQNLFESE